MHLCAVDKCIAIINNSNYKSVGQNVEHGYFRTTAGVQSRVVSDFLHASLVRSFKMLVVDIISDGKAVQYSGWQTTRWRTRMEEKSNSENPDHYENRGTWH